MKKLITLALIASSITCFVACSDDNDDKDKDKEKDTIVNNIGNPCTCEGDGCKVGQIPLPVPVNTEKIKGEIKGCEDIDISNIPGSKVVCLQTISKDLDMMAPPTYFPQGYCTISAVSCEGSTFCGTAAYGDPNTMSSCPAGSVLMTSTFNYAIMGEDSVIVNKTCAKKCETDKDCNTDGQISCLNKEGHKFCYNEKNFDFLGDNITYQEF